MIPLWAAALAALSLAVIALAAVVAAGSALATALGMRAFLRAVEHLTGPALSDVRGLIDTIRTEADAIAGTSRDIRLRIVKAADAAQDRLGDLGAVLDVMQEEVEDTVLDVAATARNVRRGLSVWRLGRSALRRARARKGRQS
jgi:methyl-accepting chemotaxis protein